MQVVEEVGGSFGVETRCCRVLFRCNGSGNGNSSPCGRDQACADQQGSSGHPATFQRQGLIGRPVVGLELLDGLALRVVHGNHGIEILGCGRPPRGIESRSVTLHRMGDVARWSFSVGSSGCLAGTVTLMGEP